MSESTQITRLQPDLPRFDQRATGGGREATAQARQQSRRGMEKHRSRQRRAMR